MTVQKSGKSNFFIRYTGLFLLLILFGFLPFLVSGRSLIWSTDAIGQYYPAFIYIGQWLQQGLQSLLQGDFSLPFFDLRIGMGEDVIGCLNYYGLGDPLNLLAVFVSRQNSAYLYTALYFLRLYLAGIAFYKYCDYMNLNRAYSNVGVWCYLFYGYTLSGGSRYIQFLSPLIYFPLLLLGCEKIFREQKARILTFAVAYAALCNFYFLYMVSLALIPYCAVRLLAKYGICGYREIIRKCLCCIGYYCLGILLAAPILLPSLAGFFGSLRTGLSPWEVLFDLKNWLPAMYKEFLLGAGCRTDALYWAEIPILEMLSLATVFFLPKTKRNLQCMLAVIAGILTWCIPAIGYVLNGFGVQTYTRWVFLIQFAFCIVLICVLEEVQTYLSAQSRSSLVKIQWYRKGIYAVMLLNIALNMFYLNSEYGLRWSSEFLTYDEVEKYIDSPVCYSDVLTNDKGLYRVSNDSLTGINGRPENVAMLNDYCGLTFWFSLVNGNTQEMINQLATKNWYNWRSYGLNNSPEYETLAGVKYYLQKDNAAMPLGYENIGEVSFYGDTWKVYENTNALPLAYVYSSAVLTEQFAAWNDIQKMGVGLEHAVLESDALKVDYAEYTDRDMPYELQTPEYELTENGLQISYEVKGECQAYLYIQENAGNRQRRIFSQTDGEETEYQCSDKRGFLHNLGSFPKDEHLMLTVESTEGAEDGLPKAEMTKEDMAALKESVQLWTLSAETLQKAVKKLQKNSIQSLVIEDNRIGGRIDTQENGCLVLAVPYHKNWKAWVDGESVQVHKANTMYMAVEVPQGQHEITFCYNPAEFQAGVLLAVFALAGLIFLKRKRQ